MHKFKKEYAQAAEIFAAIKDQVPPELEELAFYQESDSLYRAGKTEEALANFKKVFENQPDSVIGQLAQFRAGYVEFYELKDTERSLETMRKLQEAGVNSGTAAHVSEVFLPVMSEKHRKKGFEFLEEGFRALQAGLYQQALDQFDMALEINPSNTLAYSGKGLAYYFLNLPAEALRYAEKAKEITPENPFVLANLGYIYYNTGMKDQATLEFEKAIKFISQPGDAYADNIQYNLGTLYILAKKYSQAEHYLREVIKSNSRFAGAYNNLGYILWLDGRYAEAKQYLQKAVSLEPDFIAAHYNLGVVCYSLGSYEEALNEFQRVEELQPEYRKIRLFQKKIKEKLNY